MPQRTNVWNRRSGARSATGRGIRKSRSKVFSLKWWQRFIPTVALTSASLPLGTFKNQSFSSLFERRCILSNPHLTLSFFEFSCSDDDDFITWSFYYSFSLLLCPSFSCRCCNGWASTQAVSTLSSVLPTTIPL